MQFEGFGNLVCKYLFYAVGKSKLDGRHEQVEVTLHLVKVVWLAMAAMAGNLAALVGKVGATGQQDDRMTCLSVCFKVG